jgi:hypothetical protein
VTNLPYKGKFFSTYYLPGNIFPSGLRLTAYLAIVYIERQMDVNLQQDGISQSIGIDRFFVHKCFVDLPSACYFSHCFGWRRRPVPRLAVVPRTAARLNMINQLAETSPLSRPLLRELRFPPVRVLRLELIN